MGVELTDEAARQALAVLRRCVSPRGFAASATAEGYPEVWARDAGLVILGVSTARLEELVPAARTSLETLAGGQSALGRIPLSVDPAGRFTEWLHGATGRPMGRPLQAWSAAAYLLAHRAAGTGQVPWTGGHMGPP